MSVTEIQSKYFIDVFMDGITIHIPQGTFSEKEVRQIIHELSCSLFELYDLMKKKKNNIG